MTSTSETLPIRARKPRGQGASRRGEILEAAKRLFIEEGFAEATMRRIASEVGVSPTAIYLHFPDKEAILQAIAEDFFAELLVVLQRTQNHELPTVQRLRAGLRAYVDFALERVDEYRLTFNVRHAKAMAMPEEHAEPDQADLSFLVLESAVEQLLAEGTFRPGNPAVIAESIWCAMHGVTGVVMDMLPRTQSTKDDLIESVITMVLTGCTCKHPV
jgi:AcrR family transcriptional regulator